MAHSKVPFFKSYRTKHQKILTKKLTKMNNPIYVFAMEDCLEIYQCRDHYSAFDMLRQSHYAEDSFDNMDTEAIVLVHITTHADEINKYHQRVITREIFLLELKELCLLNNWPIPSQCKLAEASLIKNTPDEGDEEKPNYDELRGSFWPMEIGMGMQEYRVHGYRKGDLEPCTEQIYSYGCLTDEHVDAIMHEVAIQDVLTEAPKYGQFVMVKVSENYYEYLEKLLSIMTIDDDKYLYNFYYHHMEGYINVIETEIGYTLLLDIIEEPGKLLYNEILKHSNFIQEGLASFLDPNHGGNISETHISIASEIIFG